MAGLANHAWRCSVLPCNLRTRNVDHAKMKVHFYSLKLTWNDTWGSVLSILKLSFWFRKSHHVWFVAKFWFYVKYNFPMSSLLKFTNMQKTEQNVIFNNGNIQFYWHVIWRQKRSLLCILINFQVVSECMSGQNFQNDRKIYRTKPKCRLSFCLLYPSATMNVVFYLLVLSLAHFFWIAYTLTS